MEEQETKIEEVFMLKKIKDILNRIFNPKRPSIAENYPEIAVGEPVQPLSAEMSFEDALRAAKEDFAKAAEIRERIKQKERTNQKKPPSP